MDPYLPLDYQIALLRSDYRTRTNLPIELQANFLLGPSLYPSFYANPFIVPPLYPYGPPYGPVYPLACRQPCWGHNRCKW